MSPRGYPGRLLVLVAALLAGCGHRAAPAGGTGEVRVAAAADLKFALDELVAGFHEQHADVRVQVTSPFDLFLSADIEYPRRLIEKGLAAREDEFLYAIGHLVVWVPRRSPMELERLGVRALLDERVRKVAIALIRWRAAPP
jgi:molybdate transport system substrate-binding protein